MCKKVISVDFVLENCECINVPIGCIDFLSIQNTYSQKYIEIQNNDSKGELKEYKFISNMICRISDSKDIKNTFTWEGNITKPIDRLNQNNDITWIDFNFDDGSKESYAIKWWGDSDNYNLGQHTYFNLDGKLVIKVRKPKYRIK